MPAIPKLILPLRPSKRASVSGTSDLINGQDPMGNGHSFDAVEATPSHNGNEIGDAVERGEALVSPSIKAPPKSWADLVRTMGPPPTHGDPQLNQLGSQSTAQISGLAPARAGSLADTLSSYRVKENNNNTKSVFLEPRGLINTGNMCYMNSVSSVRISGLELPPDLSTDTTGITVLYTILPIS